MNDIEEFEIDCPPLEMLAAHLEGNLTEQESSSIEAHFLWCGRCRKLISRALKSESPIVPPLNSKHLN
jgi:predicted anti-sigma-YlaC factor YlaD